MRALAVAALRASVANAPTVAGPVVAGVALVAAMACGAVLGVVAQRLVFAPVSTASPVVKLIVSFGLAGVIQSVASLVWRQANHPNPFGHSLFAVKSS